VTKPRLANLGLLALALGCHKAPPPPAQRVQTAAAPHTTVRWADPDSSPQLQAYVYEWPPDVPRPAQCRDTTVSIDADSIGPLRIGQRLPALLAQCPAPLVGWDWGDEAIPEHALMVRFGSGAVLVTLADTTDTAAVYYLATTDTVLRTRDGVHIGMPVDSLAAQLGPLEFVEGECSLYAASKRRPYLGIQLTLPADSLDCGNLVPVSPALPRGSRVAKIFLHSAT
jgi:hypothetical protein